MDIANLLPIFAGLGLLLCLSSFFSGSETALCALTKAQIEGLRDESKKSSLAIVNFVDDPRRLFITILLGNVVVNICFATLTSALIYTLLSGPATDSGASDAGASGSAVAVATLLITILLLVFGEITPKSYAIRHARGFAGITARPLWAFSIFITPLRIVLRKITNLLLPLFGGGEVAVDDCITVEDIRSAVDVRRENILQNDEHEMLDNILELRDLEAHSIMVPRIDMIAMSTLSTIQEVLDKAQVAGFSRIPIYRDRIDKLCGIFHVKDLALWANVNLREWTVEEFLEKRKIDVPDNLKNTLVRPPYFIFKTKKLTELFAELTKEKTKIAILLDEYGGVAGSITMEDVIEEIIGDIFDEHDLPPRDVYRIDPEDPSKIHLTGRMTVREINQQFQLKMDENIADSMGGYVFALFERIPAVGEAIMNDAGIRFEVIGIEGNSIADIAMTLSQDNSTNHLAS